MSLTLDDNHAKFQIRAYQPGIIQVNNETYNQSLIVSSKQLIEKWSPQTISELTLEHLKIATALKPAVLIIGTGEVLQFPNLDLYGDLINEGIGVEIMDSSAACRTYNVLTAENRNVVAAIIIR
jgi:uncharacterized protein